MTTPHAVAAAEAAPIALTIAGSEATGGAGAQADLKTFQALGTFGIAALTCIVSFDPKADWGHRFVPVDPGVIADQLEAELAAYDIDTIKVGMLGTPATIETVAGVLREARPRNLVLDPVLICKGQEPGAALDTDTALKEQVLPLATFVTPNHFESMALSGMDAKGGVRLTGPDAIDVFYDGTTLEVLRAPKIGDLAVSGAGCTLAAAVTAELAKGASPLDAARTAKDFVRQAILHRMPSRAPFEAVRQV